MEEMVETSEPAHWMWTKKRRWLDVRPRVNPLPGCNDGRRAVDKDDEQEQEKDCET